MKNIKPILFSTPMVQAILEGRKTQTRRIIKLPVVESKNWDGGAYIEHENGDRTAVAAQDLPSKYKRGDILWVRETFCSTNSWEYLHKETRLPFFYKADVPKKVLEVTTEEMKEVYGWLWKPSIFMPRAACRIFLEVTDVRVERLQEIANPEAIAEGVEEIHPAPFVIRYKNYLKNGISIIDTPRLSFISLWISINGEGSWKANPWVFVYSFKRIEKPENF